MMLRLLIVSDCGHFRDFFPHFIQNVTKEDCSRDFHEFLVELVRRRFFSTPGRLIEKGELLVFSGFKFAICPAKQIQGQLTVCISS